MQKRINLMSLLILIVCLFSGVAFSKDSCLSDYSSKKQACSAVHKQCRPDCHKLETTKINACLEECERVWFDCSNKAKAAYKNCQK